jgi:hypothetical protein
LFGLGGQGDIASLTNASLLRGAHIVSALVKVCAPASDRPTLTFLCFLIFFNALGIRNCAMKAGNGRTNPRRFFRLVSGVL